MALFRPTYTDKKTGERKESAVWWYEFIYAGRRVRDSAKTTRKTVAAEAEKRARKDLERAHAGLPVEKPSERIRTVSAALTAYEKGYAVGHRAKSILVVKNRAAHVERLIGSLLLPDVTQERLTEYIRTRQAEGAGNRTINLDLMVLSRAMGHTWKALWPKLKKLEENQDVGRALEASEEKTLLEAAARSRSRLAFPFLMTLAWTGMRSDEARTLRWSQVDFEGGEVTVGRSKTEAGKGRHIPMSGKLRAALEQYASWYASKLGPIQPDWYVFPRSNRIKPTDPTRAATSLKRAWEKIRENAKVDCRLHDLRHSFCTKMAEAGVPESTMLDMMGHVSTAMLRRYSHIRAKARREAMTALEARASSDGVLQEVPKVAVAVVSKSAVTH